MWIFMGNKNQTKSYQWVYVVAAIIALIVLFSACGKTCGSSGNSKSATCQVCHKTFTNKDDVSSIRWRNMCERCYSNYKYTSDAMEGAKKYYENNR